MCLMKLLVHVVLRLIIFASFSEGGSCRVKVHGGKLVKEGDCEDPHESIVLRELDAKLDARKKDEPVVQCGEGFVHTRKCYYAIIRHSTHVVYGKAPQSSTDVYSVASELCRVSGGTLADILNGEHQVLVRNYIRPKISSHRSYVYVGTGMKYDYSRKVILWSNGDAVSKDITTTFHWHPGFPGSSSTYNHVGINVRREITSKDQGLINFPPTKAIDGVLCEK